MRAEIAPATSDPEELELPSAALAGEPCAPVALEGAPFTEPLAITELIFFGATEGLSHRVSDPSSELLERLGADLTHPALWVYLRRKEPLDRVDIPNPGEAALVKERGLYLAPPGLL